MKRFSNLSGAAASLAAAASASFAHAGPLNITWFSVDGGGRTTAATGGTYTLAGTIGQSDAGELSGGSLSCLGGFWGAAGSACYANCDGSTLAPILNVNDFICFNNKFAAGDPGANCDGSTTPPALNVNDFVCFNNQFAVGCP
jgi:hypothetical protein